MTAWVEAINQAINPMAMNEICNNDKGKAKKNDLCILFNCSYLYFYFFSVE